MIPTSGEKVELEEKNFRIYESSLENSGSDYL